MKIPACEVLGFHNADSTEQIHTKFCKRILHLDQFICIWRVGLQIVMYKPNPVVAKVYCEMYRKIDADVNWASLVKIQLCNLEYHDVWFVQGVTNYNSFLITCKHRLMDQYIQEWSGKIFESSGTIL